MNETTKPKRGVWPYLIVGLLVAHLLGMAAAVVVAQRNKPAVVEDYYQKAVRWDQDHPDRGK